MINKKNIIKEISETLTLNNVKRVVVDLNDNSQIIDLFIPSHNFGINIISLEETIERKKHINTTLYFGKKNIHVIHIFQDEYVNKKDLTINRILYKLNLKNSTKIYARNTKIEPIGKLLKDEFLKKFHIQGTDISKVYLGCFYNDVLISVMTFKDKLNNCYELNRFATDSNYTVVGVFSKMLKYFINESKCIEISTFADKRWSNTSNVYVANGFNLVELQEPVYHYVGQDLSRHNRQKFMKHKILEANPTLDTSKTELELMTELGYKRIYDCGNYKFSMVVKGREEDYENLINKEFIKTPKIKTIKKIKPIVNEEEILNLLSNNKTIAEICTLLKLDKGIIQKIMDKNEIKRLRFVFNDDDIHIIKEMFNNKIGEREIAKHFNCGRYKISEELKRQNLK